MSGLYLVTTLKVVTKYSCRLWLVHSYHFESGYYVRDIART